jgi:hypothetical protein
LGALHNVPCFEIWKYINSASPVHCLDPRVLAAEQLLISTEVDPGGLRDQRSLHDAESRSMSLVTGEKLFIGLN